LPADYYLNTYSPTPPLSEMSIEVYQTVCGQQSARSPGALFEAGDGPFPAPSIVGPIYGCARHVRVTGAHDGSILQIFWAIPNEPSSDSTLVNSDWYTSVNGEVVIALWQPLVAGRAIFVRQTGCNADGDSSPVTPVSPLPSPLPAPQVQSPLRPNTTVVKLTGCIPGAMVYLLVDGFLYGTETLAATAFISVPPLTAGASLRAVQALCGAISRSDEPVVVTVGTMKASANPGTVTRGTVASVTVTAVDTANQQPVPGAAVYLDNAQVGVTGTPFNYAPSAQAAPPVGAVRDPGVYNDAAFTINLQNPKPRGILFLNVGPAVLVPGALEISGVTWTVTPSWGAASTLTGANAQITLPALPVNEASGQVSISVAVDMELDGDINGVDYDVQDIAAVQAAPAPAIIVWSGSNLTAGFLALYYQDPNSGIISAQVSFQGAQ
jgi:hypothetical protein